MPVCFWNSLLVTLFTTFEGFLLAAAEWHSASAILFNQSRLIEYSLFPYTVILQVTPIVAVAPLLSDLPAATSGRAGVRLDRCLLSDSCEYDARP